MNIESQPTALVGRRLGHYNILALLGRGGMGLVYLAEDSRLRRRVALKLLPQEMSEKPDRLKRFRREAKTVAALSHPNIVTLHSVEDAEGFHFLTMELVEGETLAEAIPQGGFSVERAVEVAHALASALTAAHERGVLHRDLKPSNVMVSPTGWVKVLDFGLAKLRPEDELTWIGGDGTSLLMTQEGKILGTPSYMSPEQLRGQPADERSDVFSLGLIFYEMLSGRLPFSGETSAERIASVLRDAPQPLPELRPELPPAVVRVVERCLQKEPEKRFQSAIALREEIANLKRELEISKLIKSGEVVSSRPRRKVSRGEILGALSAFALLIAFGFWTVLSPRPEPRPESLAPAAAEAPRPGIAVLPLRNFSGDPEYFVDGMTDALIGALARWQGLRVISRQSAMHYKDSDKLLGQIASELGVDFLVEGSVAREGSQVHLQARLIRPRPEEQIWAEAFQRPSTDVMALHHDVARALARAAGVMGTARPEGRIAMSQRVDPEAYELYLQGRFWAGKFRSEDFLRAHGYLERAVALDPSFAPAWSSLGEVLAWLGKYHLEPEPTLARAEAAAERALKVDAKDATAHAVLSEVAQSRWQWQEAERQARLAIESDPSSASARRALWRILTPLLRHDEAHEQIALAAELDPLSAQIVSNLGIQLLLEKKYDQAEQVLNRARELEPDFVLIHCWYWLLYSQTAQEPERSRELLLYLDAMGFEDVHPELERRLASDGYDDALRWVALELGRAHWGDTSRFGVIAGLLAEAGEVEEALRWLRLGFEHRDWTLPWVAVEPDMRNLLGNPEFQAMLDRMGLPLPKG